MMMNKKKMMGVTFNGSVTFNGPMFDIHDNKSVTIVNDRQRKETKENEDETGSPLPDVLAQSELWQRVIDAGLVDDNCQPSVSRPEAALLAFALAERLGIANKWKLFESLWRRNNMRNDYNKALEQRKSLDFQDRLKELLG